MIRGLILVALALVAGGGCAPSTSLSGTVTVDGRPVQHGAISLRPADGKGPAAGAPIVQGRFQIDSIAPGEKLVQIVALGATTSTDRPSAGEPPEPLQRAGQAAPLRVDPPTITVSQGRHTVHFRLDAPPAD